MFSSRLPLIWQAALSGNSSHVERTQKECARQAKRFYSRFSAEELKNAVEEGLSTLEERLTILENSNWMKIRGIPIPVLRLPELFNRAMLAPATEIVLDSPILTPELRIEILDIFARSQLEETNTRYYTVDTEKGPIISGKNGSDFLSVYGIAHELGHVLLERRWSLGNDGGAKRQVLSETSALLFEGTISRPHVSPYELKLFDQFQIQSDLLNILAFLTEYQTCTQSKIQVPVIKDLPPSHWIFRESVVLKPGYQLIYALASLERIQKRALEDPWRWLTTVVNSQQSVDFSLSLGHQLKSIAD